MMKRLIFSFFIILNLLGCLNSGKYDLKIYLLRSENFNGQQVIALYDRMYYQKFHSWDLSYLNFERTFQATLPTSIKWLVVTNRGDFDYYIRIENITSNKVLYDQWLNCYNEIFLGLQGENNKYLKILLKAVNKGVKRFEIVFYSDNIDLTLKLFKPSGYDLRAGDYWIVDVTWHIPLLQVFITRRAKKQPIVDIEMTNVADNSVILSQRNWKPEQPITLPCNHSLQRAQESPSKLNFIQSVIARAMPMKLQSFMALIINFAIGTLLV